MSKINQEDKDELDWLALQKKLTQGYENFEPEKGTTKFIRKFKENPLVPVGCLATSAALCVGLYSMQLGDKKLSNLMMRTRVGAQAFTITAITVGLVYTAYQN